MIDDLPQTDANHVPLSPVSFLRRAGKVWRDRTAAILDKVFSLVRGIRAGEFPMASLDEHCTGYCPFKTVCRVNQTRSLGKTWQPPEKSCAAQ